MPLSTWEPANKTYSPSDYRLQQILYMVSGFHHYYQKQRHATPDPANYAFASKTDIAGSTAWLWQRLSSSPSPQNTAFINYFLFGATDIDLRNLVVANEKSLQFYIEKTALYDLAFHGYNGFSKPPYNQADYAQVTFTYGIHTDWTITTCAKAPLHNYDIFCTVENPRKHSIRFQLPSFPGAADARAQDKFLLNPAIFQIENGIPILDYTAAEENTSHHKLEYTNKTLACLLKTICKISMTGVTLSDHTINYLTALANTPLVKNSNILPLNKIKNGTILQSVLDSFFKVYYSRRETSNDDRYIFETALKSIKINVSGSEKSLYEIFIATVTANAEEYHKPLLLSTSINNISPTLKTLLSYPNKSAITTQESSKPTISKAPTKLAAPMPEISFLLPLTTTTVSPSASTKATTISFAAMAAKPKSTQPIAANTSTIAKATETPKPPKQQQQLAAKTF